MIELSVGGMSCSHCATSVTRAIHAIDPQARVSVNVEAGRVSIEPATPSLDLDRVRKAIEDAGYETAR
jgi:copper chaperone